MLHITSVGIIDFLHTKDDSGTNKKLQDQKVS